MPNFTTQDLLTLWAQPNGPGTAMVPMSVSGNELERHGLGDVTLPRTGRENIYAKNSAGQFKVKISPKQAPGGIPSTTITFDDTDAIDLMQRLSDSEERFVFQRRLADGGLRQDNPDAWIKLWHYQDTSVTQETEGAGPSPEASGAQVQNNVNVSFSDRVVLLRPTLSALTNAETENFLSIAVLDEPKGIPGYPGPDQIMFFGAASTGAAVAPIYYSVNGGSTIAAIGTDPSPFTQFVGISALVVRAISKTQYRLIAFAEGIAGTAAQMAYVDFNFGATTLTAASWTVLTIADAADPDGVSAALWAAPNELYIATTDGSGDVGIYLSDDYGATDPGAAIYTGANDINQLHIAPDNQIWAVGASNTLLRGNCNGFSALTGPAAQPNYSIAVANDGTVFVGNLISLYRSNNVDTGTWTAKKSFGTSHNVRHIHLPKGDPELVYAVVDDATPGPGEVWLSVDGGANFVQVTELDNDGYNAAYFSKSGLDDGNLAWIVGDDDPLGIIHKLAVADATC